MISGNEIDRLFNARQQLEHRLCFRLHSVDQISCNYGNVIALAADHFQQIFLSLPKALAMKVGKVQEGKPWKFLRQSGTGKVYLITAIL